jgi:small-conductance mechanosensitive channel
MKYVVGVILLLLAWSAMVNVVRANQRRSFDNQPKLQFVLLLVPLVLVVLALRVMFF